MLMKQLLFLALAVLSISVSCEHVDHTGEINDPEARIIPLEDVAKLLSALPIETDQMTEVHDAVSSSDGNGYDEEYMMRDLLSVPGTGVGDEAMGKSMSTRSYSRPLKELIAEQLSTRTKSSDGSVLSPEEYLDALEKSNMQIYWPYYRNWDGKEWPIVTFDPGNGAEANVGYRLFIDSEGNRKVEAVVVDEEMAASHPVWVVNRNNDSGFTSMEVHRRKDPEWGTGGGSITVRPSSGLKCAEASATAAAQKGAFRTLVLHDFKMRRNYDCWFAGASEFFIKCGSVEDFTASTEAELKLYSPRITDFMLVVKRSQMGKTIPMNVVLVSQWTDQLENIAFMLTEDDGGTRTEWKCSACVKIKSKSYGFEVALPFNSRDDIVWRGQLSAPYLEKYDGVAGRFGDVELTFSLL